MDAGFRLLDENQTLSAEAMEELVRRAAILDCECPRHLVEILRAVRAFQEYEKGCVVRSPQDADTHAWLLQAAINVDTLLSGTIVQLARMENMIDAENRLLDHPKK